MSTPRIAVTGLHRGDNPQPGSGIIRSLRRAHPGAVLVGLVYDAFESGIYADDGPDAVFTMPYPTNGSDAFLGRLDEIRARAPFDILIPTLDSEVELLVHLAEEIARRGLRTFFPTKEMLGRRSKPRLPELARACGILTPETLPVTDVGAARAAAASLGFPLMVKGQYYDAQMIASPGELEGGVSRLLGQWGAPVILQQCIRGAEFNAMGLGDGAGGVTGLCCVRKTILSDKGKGQGGMTVRDRKLEQFAGAIISELRWRGPFEVEAIKDEATGEFQLIEVNPRFPAWVDFPSAFGLNLPSALLEMIAGRGAPALPPCPAGHFFLRHQVEVHGHVEQLARFSDAGDILPDRPGALPGVTTLLP